jgi:hypothetical protein
MSLLEADLASALDICRLFRRVIEGPLTIPRNCSYIRTRADEPG